LIDEAECVIDEILRNEKHPRRFAARFIAERLGRNRGYGFRIEHENKIAMTANVYVPLDTDFPARSLTPDQHDRWVALNAVPPHQLTHDELNELKELIAQARVIDVSPDAEAAKLKPLPAPKGRPPQVEDDIESRGTGGDREQR
jgi:hypothetical protein